MKEKTVAWILLAEYWLASCLDRKFDPAGMNVALSPFLLVERSEGSAEDWGEKDSVQHSYLVAVQTSHLVAATHPVAEKIRANY